MVSKMTIKCFGSTSAYLERLLTTPFLLKRRTDIFCKTRQDSHSSDFWEDSTAGGKFPQRQ